MRHSVAGVVALALAVADAPAQEADTSARVPQDSIVARARQLVRSGKDTEGRRLLDSLLSVTPPDSARYGEALFWRGAFAATAVDAERAYRRLLIEAPLSPHAEDALLRLAQLEQARGDRRGASDHLQRFLLSYPQSVARPRVSVQLVRLLFDQGPQQLARACDVLRTARAEVPASAVELRNQLDAQAPRCAYVETQARAPVVDSAPAPVPAPAATTPDSAKRPTPPTVTPAAVAPPPETPGVARPAAAPASPTPPAPAYYSVQLAAYDSKESATRLVQQLSARGIDARLDGAAAPYRVRVGKFSTRAEAAKAAADLKAKGHPGFITLVAPTPK